MKTIEEYAIELVADGAESLAEDDMNEDGDIAEEDHDAAMDLALRIARGIRANPAAALALAVPEVDGDDDEADQLIDELTAEESR